MAVKPRKRAKIDRGEPLAYNNCLALARLVCAPALRRAQAWGESVHLIENVRFNVAQLLQDTVGVSRHVDVLADLARLAPELAVPGHELALAGGVRLMRTNRGILVTGSIAAEAILECDRCLESVPFDLSFEFEELYQPTVDMASGRFVMPEEEDEALWINEHHVLDLSEVLRQDLLVAIPMTVLCRDDCRGLCTTCGRNLNEGPCECPQEPDPRWSALKDLLSN